LAAELAVRFASALLLVTGRPAFITDAVANWLKKLLPASRLSEPTNCPGCRA